MNDPTSTMPGNGLGAEEATDDITAAMGFSAFGSKPHKKRKYNAKTDAAIFASQSQVASPNPTSLPSGSNAIPINISKSLASRGRLGSDEVAVMDDAGLN